MCVPAHAATGHLTKARVRDIAAAAGLTQAAKRSSAGICFIGRRSFSRFLEAYLQPRPGVYVDADSGSELGPCSNMLAVTVGQKALGLGGQKERVYVVGKDVGRGVVYVAAGNEHPALYSSRVLLQGTSWVAGEPPSQLFGAAAVEGLSAADEVFSGLVVNAGHGAAAVSGMAMVVGHGSAASDYDEGLQEGGTAAAAISKDSAVAIPAGVLHCQYQARYRQTAAACTVRLLSVEDAAAFNRSKFCSSLANNKAGAIESVVGEGSQGQFLLAELQAPLRGIAPGQMFVMYNGDVCLGTATIIAYGPTLYEQEG